MTSSLIQNYIATKQTPQINSGKKVDANLKTQSPALTNRAYIKPLQGKGHLVKSNIFDTPGIMIKDLAYDVKSLKHGLKGDANDHQLGKLNDVGMKLGGLAVAGYLFSKRQTPATKLMEFVGLGSFFGTMALWPKVALQLPAKLIHGFNIQQQYVDAQGRKKPFFQDPQFTPWDLMSNEEVNKIGDRLHVDKNAENRRALIQEKMKKIAHGTVL